MEAHISALNLLIFCSQIFLWSSPDKMHYQ